MTPFFSIILPTYNRASFLRRSMGSVLAQSESSWELLITDDGSSDGTWDMLCKWAIRDSRLRCWRQTNQGQTASRNSMLQHARAPWVAFLDSDDAYEPHHLAMRRAAIEIDPDVDLWISPVRVVGSPHVPCARNEGQMIHIDDCVGVGMLVVRRDALLSIGGFPKVDYAEESALMDRLVDAGVRHQRLDVRSYIYRREHIDSITHQRARAIESLQEGLCSDLHMGRVISRICK